MKIIDIAIEELKPYENNPRINDESVEYVANSIKEFGFKVPIVIDSNNVIVAGHTRYKAAEELGMEKVPCIIADDLTEDQIKAFRLADNKVSEFSTWDMQKLGIEMQEIEMFGIDMQPFGFSVDPEPIEKKERESKLMDEETQETAPTMHVCPKCGYEWED